jgi:hypothetical protein
MAVVFEALDAEKGDCLFVHHGTAGDGRPLPHVWMIDGGVPGLYERRLKAHLSDMAAERGGELCVAVGVVTHIDDDHIGGVVRLVEELTRSPRRPDTPNVSFRNFWFNSFVQTFGPSPPEAATAAVQDAVRWLPDLGPDASGEAHLFIQSVRQGETLRLAIPDLGPQRNVPLIANATFGSATSQKAEAPRRFRGEPLAGVTVEVLSPTRKRLDDLRRDWAKYLKIPEALLQATRSGLDTSVANLSSISLLLTIEGKRILLTGDGLAPHMAEGWRALSRQRTPRAIDVMKVPHHGSIRNNTEDFFVLFPARHYVFCADGTDENPDVRTLDLLFKARAGASYSIHVTSPEATPKIAAQVRKLAAHAAASNGQVSVHYRAEADRSIRITL